MVAIEQEIQKLKTQINVEKQLETIKEKKTHKKSKSVNLIKRTVKDQLTEKIRKQ